MSGPSRRRGPQLRGKCPGCWESRALATTTLDGRAPLDQAVMRRHNDDGIPCTGSGKPPVSVTT